MYLSKENVLRELLKGNQVDQMIAIDVDTVKFSTMKVDKYGNCKLGVWTVDRVPDSLDVYAFPFTDPDDPAVEIIIHVTSDMEIEIGKLELITDRFVLFPDLQIVYGNSM